METMEEEQNPPATSAKWRKSEAIVDKKEDYDRISVLPDCLLLEILSHLPSTKTAIKTGTLSKRWEHLWTLVPTLIFEQNDDNPSWPDFVSLVDKTLAQCRQSKLKKFEVIYTRFYYEHESRPNDWIRYALRCNVEELALTVGDVAFSNLQVDQSIFTASCLTDLRLSGFLLKPTGAISWKNLKILYIFFACLDENLIENILSGSPVLETLVLDECYGFSHLDIDSKSLKNLVFSAYVGLADEDDDDNDYEIKINAPNISSLAFYGDLYLWKVLLGDVSSLIEAKLDYTNNESMPNEEEEEMLKGLLLKLRHVKELKLGGSCSKVLSRLEAKGFVIPSNLKLVDVEDD